jgi:protein SCO1
MNKSRIFILVFLMLLGVAFLSYYYIAYKESPRTLPKIGNPGHKVGAFEFVNQNGAKITDKDVDGKIRVVEYFFTTCKGICPKMNENMAKVYNAFRKDKDILFLSHTVDPETDTVEQIKRYSEQFDADPNQWMFLTGDKMALYQMAVRSYLITAVDDQDYNKTITPDFIHSQYFVLVDKFGNIRGAYDGTDMKKVNKLMNDIETLRKEKN